ncbi:MAG: methionine--tRNA ligase subunit beta [Caldisphaera sp.]|uniref:methionine--tRNA ligase subunit beta n=1 Tax=Caldisphaera sp. TaxID=2060322 RepID=UPI000CAE4273|nr:MAG: methionine--tRNA ligase subunit beta [Caldisphaera sp.]PMP89054.1 MAG: methionine--tRNA ligase subunit beta [Caldisphaera sp.]
MGEAVDYSEFSKIDLRVGKILSVELVPNSRKLLKLMVDLGTEQRQILAGLQKWYKPEELVGKLVIVVANLKPKVMGGLESQGMILAAPCGEDQKPVILTPLEPVNPGSKVC